MPLQNMQIHLFYDAFVNAALIGDKAIFCTATKSVLNKCNTHKVENGRSLSGAINPSTSPHNLIQDLRVMQKFFVSIVGQKNQEAPLSPTNLCGESSPRSFCSDTEAGAVGLSNAE